MFRKAENVDLPGILTFAGKEPELNLFVVGDLEFYGLDHDFIDVWINADFQTMPKTILLRYYRNYHLYSETNDYDREEALALIHSYDGAFLNCSARCFDYLRAFIPPGCEIRPMKMARMRQLIEPPFPLIPARMGDPADAESILRSMFQIKEFHSLISKRIEDRIPLLKEKMAEGFSTHFIVVKDGVVIANANTSAISHNAAMIAGVFTLPEYRERGLATSVVARLCRYLLDCGVVPVLFFENPKAATIYHRLGFFDFANLMIVTFVPQKK